MNRRELEAARKAAKKQAEKKKQKAMTARKKRVRRDADGVYRRTLGGKAKGKTATWAGA